MALPAWLLGLIADEAATATAARARDRVVGDPAERAVEKALRNACQVVAKDLVDPGT